MIHIYIYTHKEKDIFIYLFIYVQIYVYLHINIYLYMYLTDQTCVPWFIHTCAVTHLYVWQDSLIRVPWLCHMCAKTHSHVWPARGQDKQSRHPHPSPKPLPAPHINICVYIHIYCQYILYTLLHNTVYITNTQQTSSSFAKAAACSTCTYMCIYTHILLNIHNIHCFIIQYPLQKHSRRPRLLPGLLSAQHVHVCVYIHIYS